MASEESFSDILPGWVARQARQIRARPLGASPTSLGTTEPIAAPSRRMVQQLAALVQLDEEWRVAPRRHGGTGVLDAASYHATSIYSGHACRACGSAMQSETKAGCVESDESVASFSMSTAIIEEK